MRSSPAKPSLLAVTMQLEIVRTLTPALSHPMGEGELSSAFEALDGDSQISCTTFSVGKGEALRPLPPRCRDGVDSPYLPASVFHAPGGADTAQARDVPVRDRPCPREWGDRPEPSYVFALGGWLFVIVAWLGCMKPFLALGLTCSVDPPRTPNRSAVKPLGRGTQALPYSGSADILEDGAREKLFPSPARCFGFSAPPYSTRLPGVSQDAVGFRRSGQSTIFLA